MEICIFNKLLGRADAIGLWTTFLELLSCCFSHSPPGLEPLSALASVITSLCTLSKAIYPSLCPDGSRSKEPTCPYLEISYPAQVSLGSPESCLYLFPGDLHPDCVTSSDCVAKPHLCLPEPAPPISIWFFPRDQLLHPSGHPDKKQGHQL